MLCNLSKFPSNQSILAHNESLIDSLVMCGKSRCDDDRLWSMRTFQNLATDPSSKVVMANGRILTLLSICSMRKNEDEQFAAVAALYNLSTEPGAVVSLTNTKNVVATLVHLAHNSDTKHEVRHLACDTLATIGLWLQTLAASGKVPPGGPKRLLPSHKTLGWKRWEL
uniref:Armadillo repeat-containing protein 8 n=2 Tax=Thalassionema nitzschioides TaxID=33649 RepID=A0A7S1H2B9_9STRA|mmetsp:Transcript_4572/g.3884  ORF Transcript_4572/g.3884 Transcript_4572/m.3884 type:complete len:168 (+) Transcript_4572:129-632(+)